MSAGFGPGRPIISAEEAERWAEESGLRFPELIVDEAPEWEWHDGGEGRYVGYLPADWNAPIEDNSYEMIESSDGDGDDESGIFEWFFDLGVCTVVVRGDRNAMWQDEPFAIAALSADDVSDWQQADGWFDEQVDEIDEFFEPVFDGFEEFDREMRSEELGVRDDWPERVARAVGSAERRGPYCEWVLEVRALDERGFLGLGGPPGSVRVWKFQREFETLDEAATWITRAAEELGTMVDPSSEWQNRWPG